MKPQKELTDAEYQAKYVDNKPKSPANKKYGFCEYQSNEDKRWRLERQAKWNEEGKKANETISRKFATDYQLEQMAKNAAKRA